MNVYTFAFVLVRIAIQETTKKVKHFQLLKETVAQVTCSVAPLRKLHVYHFDIKQNLLRFFDILRWNYYACAQRAHCLRSRVEFCPQHRSSLKINVYYYVIFSITIHRIQATSEAH